MTKFLQVGKPKLEKLREELVEGKKFVKFTLNIPRELHYQFDMKTTKERVRMSDVLREAIHKYMLT